MDKRTPISVPHAESMLEQTDHCANMLCPMKNIPHRTGLPNVKATALTQNKFVDESTDLRINGHGFIGK